MTYIQPIFYLFLSISKTLCFLENITNNYDLIYLKDEINFINFTTSVAVDSVTWQMHTKNPSKLLLLVLNEINISKTSTLTIFDGTGNNRHILENLSGDNLVTNNFSYVSSKSNISIKLQSSDIGDKFTARFVEISNACSMFVMQSAESSKKIEFLYKTMEINEYQCWKIYFHSEIKLRIDRNDGTLFILWIVDEFGNMNKFYTENPLDFTEVFTAKYINIFVYRKHIRKLEYQGIIFSLEYLDNVFPENIITIGSFMFILMTMFIWLAALYFKTNNSGTFFFNRYGRNYNTMNNSISPSELPVNPPPYSPPLLTDQGPVDQDGIPLFSYGEPPPAYTEEQIPPSGPNRIQ